MENCAIEGYIRNDIANVLRNCRRSSKAAVITAYILGAAIGGLAGKACDDVYDHLREMPTLHYEAARLKPTHLRYDIPKNKEKTKRYNNFI